MRKRDWKVLAIPATTDIAAIKRAYSVQLKLHRPHEDPEGFQRLRTVYSQAVEWATFEALREHTGAPAPGATMIDLVDNASIDVSEPTPRAIDDGSDGSPPAASAHEAPAIHELVNALPLALARTPISEARRAVEEWCSEPGLAEFGARRDHGDEVFEIVLQWAATHAEAWTEARERREIVLRLNEVFRWTDDELHIVRQFPAEDTERVLRMLDPVESVAIAPRTWATHLRDTIGSMNKLQIVLFIGMVLFISGRLFDAALDDEPTPNTPSNAPAAPR